MSEQEPEEIPFPVVLHAIITNENTNDCIHWFPCGKRFMISDKASFTQNILPDYFAIRNNTRFPSFTRRLKRWYFERVPSGPQMGAYYRDDFLKDQPELAKKIVYTYPPSNYPRKKRITKPKPKSKSKHPCTGSGDTRSNKTSQIPTKSPRQPVPEDGELDNNEFEKFLLSADLSSPSPSPSPAPNCPKPICTEAQLLDDDEMTKMLSESSLFSRSPSPDHNLDNIEPISVEAFISPLSRISPCHPEETEYHYMKKIFSSSSLEKMDGVTLLFSRSPSPVPEPTSVEDIIPNCCNSPASIPITSPSEFPTHISLSSELSVSPTTTTFCTIMESEMHCQGEVNNQDERVARDEISEQNYEDTIGQKSDNFLPENFWDWDDEMISVESFNDQTSLVHFPW